MTTIDPAGDGYATLGLLVRNATTTFDLVSYSRGRWVPGGVLPRAPRIGTADDADLPDDTGEIVATVLDAGSRALDEFGWSTAPRAFHDHLDDRGRACGFARRSEDGTRAFHLPIPRGAASIRFRLLRKGTPEALLATILLRGKGAEVQGARNVIPIDFQVLPPSRIVPGGHIDLRRSRRTHDGKDDPRFDIVITGDGFAEADMDHFLREANGLIKGLRAMRPFKALDRKINYHVLAAVSDQSGITDAQTYPGGPRKTYFHSTTEFENPTFRTAIGTPYPELIKTAVEAIRPWCEIDLVIVIANIDMYGGYAIRQHGTVFISREKTQSMWVLVNLAAHEGGHVIAKLADEYISGSAYDRSDVRPNVATAEQVHAGTVPWKALAKKRRALHSNGKPKLVHEYDSAWNLAEQEPKLAPREMKRIGAFWGCMYTKPPADPSTRSISLYDDQRGADFYRPSARCLMRKMDQDFCDVCADAIAQAILRKVKHHVVPRRRRTAAFTGYRPPKMPLAARPHQQR